MARASLEKLKDSIGTVMVEHERDRESLVSLLSHANKMLNKYQSLLEHEEQLIEDFANERKAEVRKLFSQLRATENERIEHLENHIEDMDGNIENDTRQTQDTSNGSSVIEQLDVENQKRTKQVSH